MRDTVTEEEINTMRTISRSAPFLDNNWELVLAHRLVILDDTGGFYWLPGTDKNYWLREQ